MAAQHWRSIRVRFMKDGISDPMALSSLGVLLDMVEAVVLESLMAEATKPEDAKAKRAKFMNALYAPTSDTAKKLNGDGYLPPPAGFDAPREVETAFDGFAALLGGKA